MFIMKKEEQQRALLLKLRSKLVGKNRTLPYTIYTDRNIGDLLKAQPKSLAELAKIKGFPETGVRFKGFGEAIVGIFTGVEKIESIEVTEKNGDFIFETKLKRMNIFK